MDTAEWDAVLAGGGRVELRHSRAIAVVHAVVAVVPLGLGVAGLVSGRWLVGAFLVIMGAAGVLLQLRTLNARAPVVILSADSIAFRERRRMRTVPWGNVLGARVVRISWDLPVVLLDLRPMRRAGRTRRAVLPMYLEVRSGVLRAWIDHRVGHPVRR